MIHLDLHVHSVASDDGGITKKDLVDLLAGRKDRFIAITDHGTTEFARNQKANFGNKIIVGQEVKTTHGDVIGLFLKEDVPEGLHPQETIESIKRQGGLVYIPHPFDVLQHHGLGHKMLSLLAPQIDIIEYHNARSITPGAAGRAKRFAQKHGIALATASDGHGPKGIGRGYVVLEKPPTRKNLIQQLALAKHVHKGPTIGSLLEPSRNRRAAK